MLEWGNEVDGVSTIDIPTKESHPHGWICKFSNFFSFFQVSLWSSILMCFWPCKCLGFVMGCIKMKTWHLRRGRNMYRIDFWWCMLENVKKLLLLMFLHAWARTYVHSLNSCICSSILAYTGMFLRSYVCRNGLAYAGSCLCTWALTCICETLGRSPTLTIFTSFSFVSLLYAFLTHLFVIFAHKYHCILLLSSFLHQKHHFS